MNRRVQCLLVMVTCEPMGEVSPTSTYLFRVRRGHLQARHGVRPKLLAHPDTKAGQDALLKYMNMLEADLQLIHVPVKGNLNSTVWNNIREGEESYLRSAKVYVGWVQLLAGVLTFLTQLKWYIGCCIYCCSNTNGRHPPVVDAG